MGLELLINKTNVLVLSPNCFTVIRLFLPDLFIQVVIKNVNKMGYQQVIDRCLLPHWQYLNHLTTVFRSD